MTSSTLSSALAQAITGYLSLKRSLGRKFVAEGYVLASLDRFLVEHPSTDLSAESFASWCLTLAHVRSSTRRARMRIVRNLCLYMRRTRPECFVPDIQTFPAVSPPRPPHIFSEEEIVQLLRTASELPPRSGSPLRSQSYRLAVVLLYTVGLRRALGLRPS